jgi:hypothetical protein
MKRWTSLGVALLAVSALATGCSQSPGSSDGGSDGGPGDSGPGLTGGQKDAGTPDGGDGGRDAGPSRCQSDSDCLAVALRCSPDGGCTLPAQSCDPSQGSSNCALTSYCWIDGVNTTNECYCDPLPAGFDGGGACVNPIDCGPAAQVDNPGTCAPVGSSGNYCLPLDTGGACPSPYLPGTVDDMNVCVPSCGSCPCAPCAGNGDCPTPAAGVCNERNGVCEAPCQAQTDCLTGEVCNVLGKYLDPAVGSYYAAGQCGAPCTQASDCAVYQGDAGLPYFCDADAGDFCRPTACIADSDCAQAGLSSGSVVAWCDIWDGNVCTAAACRLGDDPLTDQPFDDCLPGYVCHADGGSPAVPDAGPPLLGTCLATPCNEVSGGAHTACTPGQLCCGEGDAGTHCPGATVGECYSAPRPPWCVSCDPGNGTLSNPACAGVDDGYPGAVACLTARGLGNTASWCGPACNPNEPWTCPSGWDCVGQDGGYNCSTRDGCPDAG